MATVLDASASTDQVRFWQAVIQAIAGKAGVDAPSNVVMASQGIACRFAGSLGDAQAQVVDLGNTIPAWSQTWTGETNDSFFKTYQSFIDGIHPRPDPHATAADVTQMDTIRQNIAAMQDRVGAIRMQQYLAYLQDNCLQLSADGRSCSLWTPGAGLADFAAQWQEYQKGSEFQEQVETLKQMFGADLQGLTDQFNTLAEKVYGPNYREIAEAEQAVSYADPENFSNDWSKATRTEFQVQVNEGGATLWQPRFELQQGQDFTEFATWLQQVKNAADKGQDPDVSVELSNSTQTQDSTHWQFSAHASIPVEDFFMVGVSASGSHSTLDVSKYDFKATVTYQGVKHVPLGPAPSWYQSALLNEYRDYAFPANSPFAGKALWGPDGIFNLRVSGVIVGYQPWVKVEVSDWTHSEAHTTWSESSSFSILGLINLGSESASGGSDSVKYTSTDTGFELKDTSGEPQILALVLEALPPQGA